LLVFGMRCAFSAPPLDALVRAGCDVRALVLPAPPGAPPVRVREPGGASPIRLPVAGVPIGVEEIAARAGVPVIDVADLRSPEMMAVLSDLRPDAIAVACFPWRIPGPVRVLPRLGCVNLHPSLLPRWRGPEPLFWTFMAGDAESGVTVHRMDGGFDTGPIVAQRRIPVPPGVDGLAFERQLAALGGDLLVASISGLDAGLLTPVPQDATLATYAPMPDDDDLTIGSNQPATRIADLVRGIVPLWGPLNLRIARTGAEIAVNGVLAIDLDGSQPEPVVWSGQTVRVQCRPGVAHLTLARPAPAVGR
jgi:methionyl-tRNA formyltransferase